jgi:hypothetical protein
VVDVGNDGEIADVLHAVVLCHRVPFVGETGEHWGSAPIPAYTLFKKGVKIPKTFIKY